MPFVQVGLHLKLPWRQSSTNSRFERCVDIGSQLSRENDYGIRRRGNNVRQYIWACWRKQRILPPSQITLLVVTTTPLSEMSWPNSRALLRCFLQEIKENHEKLQSRYLVSCSKFEQATASLQLGCLTCLLSIDSQLYDIGIQEALNLGNYSFCYNYVVVFLTVTFPRKNRTFGMCTLLYVTLACWWGLPGGSRCNRNC